MDTFPFESWEEAAASAGDSGFFTFGDGAAGLLVAIMIVVTVIAFIAWTRVEGRKLDEQAARLRGASGAGPSMEG